MNLLMNKLEKQRAKKLAVRIQDFANIDKAACLLMEQYSRLGDVRVKLPDSDVPLRVGAYSYVREGGEINHLQSIGRFCSIGRNVFLGQQRDNHPIYWVSSSMSVSGDYVAGIEYATIGNDVWIAHNAVVMAGVNVGHGAVIGRNAVVTKDVDPYQIVVGNPAKVVKTRFTEEQISALLASEWWDYDMLELRQMPFDNIEKFISLVPELKTKADYATVSIRDRKVRR